MKFGEVGVSLGFRNGLQLRRLGRLDMGKERETLRVQVGFKEELVDKSVEKTLEVSSYRELAGLPFPENFR